MNSNGRTYSGGVFVRAAVGVALFLLFSQSGRAQTVVATIPLPVGGEPSAVAVNTLTDKIYVVVYPGGVSVIDGHTGSTTPVPAGLEPIALAVNQVTNKIYVANRGNWLSNRPGSVTVIDGATNSTATVNVPPSTFPAAVAVNPETNKIYVVDLRANVMVIDGATNNTTTLTLRDAFSVHVAVAVNPVTDKIYVASANSQSLSVIDGATNAVTSVPIVTSADPEGHIAIAVNTVTNRIYVASDAVTVIDGETNSTTRVIDPNAIGAGGVAVNPVTNKIYVANGGDYPKTNHGNVTVIDGVTNRTTTITDPTALAPLSIAVNVVSNRIYVTNGNSSALNGNGGVTVIDGVSDSFATVVDPKAKTDEPAAIAVDPATDKIYVANAISDNVTVIDGGIATHFSVAVPNVVGQARTAATAAIVGAGLLMGTVTQQFSSTVASGDLISESPTAGTLVASPSAVNVVISNAIAVPNVVGMTESSATAGITDAGLVVGTVTHQASSKVASGYVISASPGAGTNVAPSSAVNLVVSSADPSVGGSRGGGGGLDWLTLGLLLGCLLFAVRKSLDVMRSCPDAAYYHFDGEPCDGPRVSAV
jgi:YVTN family beta-propeller protein